MKISKIFGFVLSLHAAVIALLLVQSGCQTKQPPTPNADSTYRQDSTRYTVYADGTNIVSQPETTPVARENTYTPSREAPRRPVESLDAFNDVPMLEPVPTEPLVDPVEPMPSVDIAGPAYETYYVKKGDSLWKLSKEYSVSLADLYAANGLSKNSTLSIGQELKIPVEGSVVKVSGVNADTYQPTSYNVETKTYTVQPGDSLSKIAKQNGISVRSLKAANNKTTDLIKVGEKLLIPVGESASTPVSSNTPVLSGDSEYYTVKAGDNPSTIAKKYGISTTDLLSMNGISDPRKLQVGQKLIVGAATPSPSVPVSTPTSITPAQPEATVAITPVLKAADENPVTIKAIDVDAETQAQADADALDTDALFENAIEIPVIRMETE